MKNEKFFIGGGLLILLILLIAGFTAYKMYTKPARSVDNESAVTIAAATLAGEYEADETQANKKYLDKAIEVTGVITDITTDQQHNTVVMLSGTSMSNIKCAFPTHITALKKGDHITVKGFCTGYLTDVVLNLCKTVPLQ